MLDMERELTYEDKVTFRSVGEVRDAINLLLSRAGRRVRRRGGKALNKEWLLNCAVLAIQSMPDEDLIRVLTEAVGRLEAILRDGAGEAGGEVPSPGVGEESGEFTRIETESRVFNRGDAAGEAGKKVTSPGVGEGSDEFTRIETESRVFNRGDATESPRRLPRKKRSG